MVLTLLSTHASQHMSLLAGQQQWPEWWNCQRFHRIPQGCSEGDNCHSCSGLLQRNGGPGARCMLYMCSNTLGSNLPHSTKLKLRYVKLNMMICDRYQILFQRVASDQVQAHPTSESTRGAVTWNILKPILLHLLVYVVRLGLCNVLI